MPLKKSSNMALYIHCSSTNPLDSTTYYVGMGAFQLSTSTNIRYYMPKSGKIRRIALMFNCTAGTNEAIELDLRKNGTTDYLLSNTFTLDADLKTLIVDNINLNVVAGDYIALKIITPAWVGNPTAVVIGGNMILQY